MDLSVDQPLWRIQGENSYKIFQDLIDTMKMILSEAEDDNKALDDATVKTKAAGLQLSMPPFAIKLDYLAGNQLH